MVITPGTSLGVTALLVAIMMAISAGFWVVFVYTLDHRIVRRGLERGQQAVNRVFDASSSSAWRSWTGDGPFQFTPASA